MKRRIVLAAAIATALGLSLTACATTESSQPAATNPAETVTVEKTVTETEPADEEALEAEAPVEEEAPAETAGQANARESAEDYLAYTAFSRKGLIEQLKFEGYSKSDATYAVDAVSPDWNEQAAKAAKDYLDYSSFSRSGLIEQLEFEGYTSSQAEYGVNQTGL
jgi:hypothetical protein